MNLPDEVLMAYADGELDARTRAEVEQAMTLDPEISKRVAAHAAIRQKLHSAFDAVLNEPVPDRLLEVLRPAATAGPGARVIPFKTRTAARRKLPQWAALAASFALGAVALQLSSYWRTPDPVSDQDGQIVASGALAQALSSQLVSEQTASSGVRIGVSFRSHNGNYCRTFQLSERRSLAGVACRSDDKWKLEMLAAGQAAGGSQNGNQAGYRQASSSMPPAVAAAVEASIEGEPLDAKAEANARASQWQPAR